MRYACVCHKILSLKEIVCINNSGWPYAFYYSLALVEWVISLESFVGCYYAVAVTIIEDKLNYTVIELTETFRLVLGSV